MIKTCINLLVQSEFVKMKRGGGGMCSHMVVLASIYVVLLTSIINVCRASAGGQLVNNNSTNCNVYEGKWVYDQTYPLYNSTQCPFIRKEFDCAKYGRSHDHDNDDDQYLKYRWQPNHCDLPRYNFI